MIRAANPVDAPAIDALLRAAFGGGDEAALVHSLRAEGVVRLELVAARGGTLLGHILFSAMTVGATPALALAPLAVAPEVQRQGVGRALMRAGLRLVPGWCLVLGAPAFYGCFGFLPATGITGVSWAGHPAFQARPPHPGAVVTGIARYPCAFGPVSAEHAHEL